MDRLLTDEKIEAIQIPTGLDIQIDPLWWDKLVAKAQDTETLKAVGEWLNQHTAISPTIGIYGLDFMVITLSAECTIRAVQSLLHGEMPGGDG